MKVKANLGATYMGDNLCHFLVWAPFTQKVEVHIIKPREKLLPLASDAYGYYHLMAKDVAPGSLYLYRLNGQQEYPDPASHCQPRGIHGPSQVVDPNFRWNAKQWLGLPLQEYIIYELHVGTFTPEGTFDAIIPHLDELKELGVTALELMPVAQFPGNRNWGYDGVYPFAVQNSYGGPAGLKRLVNACHQKGLAVVLDVVYNHIGPEGNYLNEFGPYFTDRYLTPWGKALNFDGPHSDEVRRFFIENAIYWLTEFHIDALRLDALHAILDIAARPFLAELATTVQEQMKKHNRKAYLIGESSANDARLIRPKELGGYGLDAQWNDDFHHSLHVLLTGERTGYYQDFGQLQHLVKAFQEGFVYSGEYSSYRQRRHGISSRDVSPHRFVVFAQNHDQIGNRAKSERLSQHLSFEKLKLAASIVLLSPFIPLIFMGEEYAELAPFPYFISHSDPSLIEAVRRGRSQEFLAFQWPGEPPDPHSEATFLQAKLNRQLRNEGHHRVLLEFYRELIRYRQQIPALACLNKDTLKIVGYEPAKLLFIQRWEGDNEVIMVFNFHENQTSVALPIPEGCWRKLLDSEAERWQGRGETLPEQINSEGDMTLTLEPAAFALFVKET